jgi:predicted helicase
MRSRRYSAHVLVALRLYSRPTKAATSLLRRHEKERIKFDLAILDEAHKTVVSPSKKFATLLKGNKINIRRRVFMTATERVPRDARNDVPSMDNEKDYGKRFFYLSFKEAIKQQLTRSG